jgi:hypothetical protein
MRDETRAETPHPAALPDDVLLARCEVMRSRGSGPGGRHRNSTESRVVVRDRATGVEAVAGERRSQHDNLRVALHRLRCELATSVRTTRAAGALPSALWLSRLRGGRVECNPEHRDFPALLAEALDVVAASAWDHRAAAETLRVSPTQFVRFAALHKPALAELNRRRAELGMARLRG